MYGPNLMIENFAFKIQTKIEILSLNKQQIAEVTDQVLIIQVVAIDNVGEPSPVMATFLKIATETVYKMAGLGAFEASVAYKVNLQVYSSDLN